MQRRSQEDRSRSTRTALEEAGRRLFAERGFAAVSAEEIVAAAGVTRGALHHHYGDKRGLFLAVLEQVEVDGTAEVEAAIAASPDPDNLLLGMALGVGAFLKICQRPEMVRIVLTDGPTVLGWQAFREFESRHGLRLITEQLAGAQAAGLVGAASVPVLAQLLLCAITEAGLVVAHAEDQETAGRDAEQALLMLIGGIVTPGAAQGDSAH